MILGVLSDSHGHATRVAHALAVLEAVGAEAFVHCGDVGEAPVLDQLAGRRAWFVWGNTDRPSATLQRYVQHLGLPTPDRIPLDIKLDGKRIRVGHGHEHGFEALLDLHEAGDDIPDADQADYILHGHTHVARYAPLASGASVMNPGALQRAQTYSVATLDLASGAASFWVVNENLPPSSLVPFEL